MARRAPNVLHPQVASVNVNDGTGAEKPPGLSFLSLEEVSQQMGVIKRISRPPGEVVFFAVGGSSSGSMLD